MSVDLPAPFSPTTACTSPARLSKLTSSSAVTPGKVMVMFRISTRLWAILTSATYPLRALPLVRPAGAPPRHSPVRRGRFAPKKAERHLDSLVPLSGREAVGVDRHVVFSPLAQEA